MKHERQEQLFGDEQPVWESIDVPRRETIQQVLSLLLEQELMSSMEQSNQESDPNHV